MLVRGTASLSMGIVIVLAVALVTGQAATNPSDTLVVGTHTDVNTWDPHRNTVVTTEAVLINVYETLIAWDAQLRLKPGLAISWRQVEPTLWEFKLRRGVKFQNGEPFNAQAVKFSFDRALNPQTKWSRAGQMRLIKSVSIVDDFTIRISTERPWALLLPSLARHGWIVPPGYVQTNGAEVLLRRPVGTGPYKFVRWIKDDRVELEANSGYWGGQPRIRQVTIRTIPNDSTRLAELLAGSVHLINQVPPELFDPIKQSRRAKLVLGPSIYLVFIIVDLKKIKQGAPLADKRVRQAMNFAIDRNALVNTLLKGAAAPLSTFCSPVSFGCDISIPPIAYDPESARKLLRDAGYPDGFDMTISTTDGSYIEDRNTVLAVAEQLRRVGIRARVVVLDFGVHLQQLLARKMADDATYLPSSGLLGHAGADNAGQVFHSKGIVAMWNNPDFDKLLDTAEGTFNEAKAKDILRQAQHMFRDEAPAIPLFILPNADGLSRRLEWTPRPDNMLPIFNANWQR